MLPRSGTLPFLGVHWCLGREPRGTHREPRAHRYTYHVRAHKRELKTYPSPTASMSKHSHDTFLTFRFAWSLSENTVRNPLPFSARGDGPLSVLSSASCGRRPAWQVRNHPQPRVLKKRRLVMKEHIKQHAVFFGASEGA